MEEASEYSMVSSYSAHANGMNEWNQTIKKCIQETWGFHSSADLLWSFGFCHSLLW